MCVSVYALDDLLDEAKANVLNCAKRKRKNSTAKKVVLVIIMRKRAIGSKSFLPCFPLLPVKWNNCCSVESEAAKRANSGDDFFLFKAPFVIYKRC